MIVRIALENPTWGYSRIVGALQNLGVRRSETTIANILQAEGIKPTRYRPGEPLMNIYAERFVKSIKHECIEKLILVGEGSLRKAVSEYVIHYNEERNHQGIDNQLINPRPGSVIPVGDPQAVEDQSEIDKTGRLGEMLNF